MIPGEFAISTKMYSWNEVTSPFCNSDQVRFKSNVFFLKFLESQAKEEEKKMVPRLLGTERMGQDCLLLKTEGVGVPLQVHLAAKNISKEEYESLGNQILSILLFLEKNQVIHGSLSLNKFCLFDSENSVKLVDLERAFVAGSIQPDWQHDNLTEEEREYASPERLAAKEGQLTRRTDVWSVGKILEKHFCKESASLQLKLPLMLQEHVKDRCLASSFFPSEKREDLFRLARMTGKVLGKGNFGDILEGVGANGEGCALKFCKEADKNTRVWHKFLEEERILRYLSHIPGVIASFGTANVYYKGKEIAGLILEQMDISLADYIDQGGPLPLCKVRDFTSQLASTLRAIHRLGVVHFDISPQNILLRNSTLKVADFGLSALAKTGYLSERLRMGNRQYIAPEMLLRLPVGQPADLWSLGSTIAEMYVGDLIFPAEDLGEAFAVHEIVLNKPYPQSLLDRASAEDRAAYEKNKKNESLPPQNYKYFKDLTALMSDASTGVSLLRDAIDKCLVYEPDKRITAEELADHPFINQGGLS